MAADNIEICNLALLQIGQRKIAALTANTKEADACEFLYARTLRSLLRAYDWPFATKSADLGAATETAVSGWSYEYTIPTDHLRTIRLEDEGENGSGADGPGSAASLYKFEIRGTKLLCNVEDAWLTYVYSVTDTTTFPDLFEDALVYKLASELAMPITGKAEKKKLMMQSFDIALQHAMAVDSDEPTFIPLEGDLIAARA